MTANGVFLLLGFAIGVVATVVFQDACRFLEHWWRER